MLCKSSSNHLSSLTDLLVTHNCLIHNLWEEMISYELQIAAVKLLIQYWVFKMLHLPLRSHGAFLLRDWGKNNFRFPGTHTRALMWICRYRWACAFTRACDFLWLTKAKHPTFIAALSKKRYKRHLITFVWFIWGDSYLSNSPIRDNNEEEMGWVCTGRKRSFFLLLSCSLPLLSSHFSLLWLMLYSKLSLVKLIFFQRLQNRIHKGKSYETVKIDHNLEEIQMCSLLLSSLQRNTLIWYEFLRRNFKLT